MDRKLLIALSLVVLGILAISASFFGKSEEIREEDLIKVSYGNVQVTAIYLNPKYPELKRPTFYLRLDTHSGDLYVYDIKNSTVLEVSGKKYRPVSWKEDEQSWGHHRMGVLEFPEEALKEIKEAREFRVVMKIEGERVLEWRL